MSIKSIVKELLKESIVDDPKSWGYNPFTKKPNSNQYTDKQKEVIDLVKAHAHLYSTTNHSEDVDKLFPDRSGKIDITEDNGWRSREILREHGLMPDHHPASPSHDTIYDSYYDPKTRKIRIEYLDDNDDIKTLEH